MSTNENAQAKFDAEWAALDAFLDARPGLAAQPERDDPDVRRVLEAMAYFSARSQAALERGMREAVERMVSVPVADLATAMPAMGLLRATPAADLDGVIALPAGTLLRVASVYSEGERAEDASLFSTVLPLALRPIEIVSAQIDRSGDAPALLVKLRASVGQRGAFELAMHVRRMDAYRPSARLFDALERGARGASVCFDGVERASVALSFAMDRGAVGKLVPSPIAMARSLLQLPEQDLVMRASLAAASRPWTRAELRVELDPAIANGLTISSADLALFVVSMVNAWSDPCPPMAFDGTQDALPLRLGGARAGAELLRVCGVYDADREMRPLLSLALGTQREGWELIDDGRVPMLRVRVGDPSRWPAKIVADAHWTQSSRWRASARVSSVALQRAVPKAKLAAMGLVRRASESALREDPSWALDMAALRSRGVMNRSEIVALLEGMGARGESPFASVVSSIEVGAPITRIDAATGALERALPLRWNVRDEESAAVARQLQKVLALVLDALFDGTLVLDGDAGRWDEGAARWL